MNKTYTKKTDTKKKKALLPYSVIVAAVSGNVDAINKVLKHYEGYIATLSTRTLYDEAGTPYLCVDEELRCRLETKIITKVLVQHCANNGEYSTCYLRQYRVVVSQQCHRIASFLRLVLTQISDTVFHRYLGNAVLGFQIL
ncbi:MAG: helix-turn-helix domain-containing protein [Lachnospiraceae bacterium]|nr:helix-turn-helix domain-containing protein [Lachnospiraceae bacterium]